MKLPEANLAVDHLNEPELDFRHGQRSHHPKDGLFLYGPHQARKKPQEVRIGVIGTQEGLGHFGSWSRRLLEGIRVPPPGPSEKKDRLHLADFAGLEETFGITFDPERCRTLAVEMEAIDRATRLQNMHEAVDAVARVYIDRLEKFRRNEEGAIDVWLFVVPEIVYERCRPESRRTGLALLPGKSPKKQRTREDLPLLSLDPSFDTRAEDIFDDVPDFRRHIKAKLLSIAPSQILRETTLEPGAFPNSAGYPTRTTQDPATVAWNLATGIYYKTQERPPWRLSDVRDGVCYIGMVYKNLPNNRDNHVCCAAQMFLGEGDGVVFRGANGPWKTGDYEYHLSATAAEDLLATVIEAYEDAHSAPPKELFIHGQASFNDEEWEAFCRAAPPGTNVVGVRIRSTNGDTKLFRDGDYPVIRGTALHLDDRNAYLWTSGYVPQLDTYIGPETPNPLIVTILRAKYRRPAMQTVLADIMGLTKINYNTCNFNDGLPVTVRFAKMVGDILVMGSAKVGGPQPFKFYV
ncbi:hypothetical protein [Roseivivax sp. THAF30]|uniref:argonaute/piwi family protein n=1 Tax=Roseivivax sp. THAF30 TaxID=2587852 RepID=UPI00126985C6|nr:hypothetical protein [Roseivivax sp. THAF30]QFT61800.1 hypothetical protein FIU91_02570 [Roseivivax sp. THAF30]